MAVTLKSAGQGGSVDSQISIDDDGSLVAEQNKTLHQIDVFNPLNQALIQNFGDKNSFLPVISGDGHTLIFNQDNAGNVAVEKVNLATATAITLPGTGTGANFGISVSQDGTAIALTSNADPANKGFATGNLQAYIYSTQSALPVLVSQTPGGTAAGLSANGNPSTSIADSISADGKTVALESDAQNLLTSPSANDLNEVFTNNQQGNALTLASANSDGTALAGFNGEASVSGDGKQVAFVNNSAGAGPGQIFVKNFAANGALTLVTTLDGVNAIQGSASNPVISADGRFVAFTSDSTSLQGSNGFEQVYVKDLANPSLAPVLISVNSQGIAGNANSSTNTTQGTQLFSSDDTQIAFTTAATNLLSGNPTSIVATVPVTPLPSTTTSPATIAFTNVGFTDTGTLGDGITNNPAVVLSGTETNATSVEVFEGSKDLGPATINTAAGTWSLAATLAPGLNSGFTATAMNALGSVSASNATAVTLDQTPPTVAFNPTVSFTNPGSVTFTGTTSGTSVEIFEGSTDLGAASVDAAAGTFTFTHTFPTGFHNGLAAVATDAAGNKTPNVGTDLDVTIGGPRDQAKLTVDNYDTTGLYLGSTAYTAKGGIYSKFTYSHATTGQDTYTYTGGSLLASQGLMFEKTTYDRRGNLASNIIGVANNGKSNEISADGSYDTFVFKHGYGADTITTFNPSDPHHDTLALSRSEFASFTDVLNNAVQHGADTVITGKAGDQITLQNVALSSLVQADFRFHP